MAAVMPDEMLIEIAGWDHDIFCTFKRVCRGLRRKLLRLNKLEVLTQRESCDSMGQYTIRYIDKTTHEELFCIKFLIYIKVIQVFYRGLYCVGISYHFNINIIVVCKLINIKTEQYTHSEIDMSTIDTYKSDSLQSYEHELKRAQNDPWYFPRY